MSRPQIDQDVLELIHAIGQLARRVRASAGASELSLIESSIVKRLEQEGSHTVADLARAESVRPQSMGAAIARLEARGVVERTPHPTDRRQVQINLTYEALRLRRTTREAKTIWLKQAINRLEDEDRDTVLRAAGIFKRIAESEQMGT